MTMLLDSRPFSPAAAALEALSMSELPPDEEFAAALEGLGISQKSFGDWIGVSARTVYSWSSKSPKNGAEPGPPVYVWRLIRLMQRAYIPAAPARPTLQEASDALAPALNAILSDAEGKQWPKDIIVTALLNELEIRNTVNKLGAKD